MLIAFNCKILSIYLRVAGIKRVLSDFHL